MKTFIASGFGAGIFWRTFFGEKKGGGSFASLVFVGIIYYLIFKAIILWVGMHEFLGILQILNYFQILNCSQIFF